MKHNLTVVRLLTFLAVATAVLGAYSLLTDLFLRDRSRVSQRVDRELRMRQREMVRDAVRLQPGFDQLAAVAEGGEQQDAGQDARRGHGCCDRFAHRRLTTESPAPRRL